LRGVFTGPELNACDAFDALPDPDASREDLTQVLDGGADEEAH